MQWIGGGGLETVAHGEGDDVGTERVDEEKTDADAVGGSEGGEDGVAEKRAPQATPVALPVDGEASEEHGGNRLWTVAACFGRDPFSFNGDGGERVIPEDAIVRGVEADVTACVPRSLVGECTFREVAVERGLARVKVGDVVVGE